GLSRGGRKLQEVGLRCTDEVLDVFGGAHVGIGNKPDDAVWKACLKRQYRGPCRIGASDGDDHSVRRPLLALLKARVVVRLAVLRDSTIGAGDIPRLNEGIRPVIELRVIPRTMPRLPSTELAQERQGYPTPTRG